MDQEPRTPAPAVVAIDEVPGAVEETPPSPEVPDEMMVLGGWGEVTAFRKHFHYLDLMATLLDEVSLPFVDLRTVWADHPSEAIADERGQELEIHPDAAGHAVLAEAVFGSAGALLAGSLRN